MITPNEVNTLCMLNSVISSCCRSGDITKLNTIAIVNTTNESLSNRGVLSERIHRSAGPELLQECKTQLLGKVPSLFQLYDNSLRRRGIMGLITATAN